MTGRGDETKGLYGEGPGYEVDHVGLTGIMIAYPIIPNKPMRPPEADASARFIRVSGFGGQGLFQQGCDELLRIERGPCRRGLRRCL